MLLSKLIQDINSSSIRSVAKKYNISLSKLWRILKDFERKNYIVANRIGKKVEYTVLNDVEIVSFSSNKSHYLCENLNLRYHNLTIKVPLLNKKEINVDAEKVIKLKNNVERKIFRIKSIAKGEIISVNGIPKNLIIYLPTIKTEPENLEKTLNIYTRLIYSLDNILVNEYRIFADFSQIQILRQHISIEGDIPEFPLTTYKSKEEAKSIQEYKENAWLRLGEKSQGIDEIETNDINFAQAFYQMPFRVEKLENTIANKLTPVLEELSKQIKLHLEVMQEIKESIKEMRDLFKKINFK